MTENRIIHIAPRVTPIPMPALAPVLSPELEFGVDDRVGVEETLLDVRLDCIVEEDNVLSGADVDVDVGVGVDVDVDVEADIEVGAKSNRFSDAGA